MFMFGWTCFFGQFLAQLHVGTRREALHYLLLGNIGSDSIGNKVVETVTRVETTGSDDQKRSNQCHYVCIKLKVNTGKAEEED